MEQERRSPENLRVSHANMPERQKIFTGNKEFDLYAKIKKKYKKKFDRYSKSYFRTKEQHKRFIIALYI